MRASRLVAPSVRAEALLAIDSSRGTSRAPLQDGGIDQILDKEFKAGNIELSPLTTDERFLGRVALDLTGQLPAPEAVQ